MRRSLLAPALAVALAGCLPDGLTDYDFEALQPPQPQPEAPAAWERLGEAPAGDVRVHLWAEGGARAGFLPLRIGLTDEAGSAVRDARVTVTAEVARGDAWLAAPVQGPASTAANGEGYFEAAAFLFPEADGARARLRVAVDAGVPAEAPFEFAVAAHRWAVRADRPGSALWAAWVAPRRAVLGENAFEAALFEETPAGLVPFAGAQLQLYPYMDMGGGDGHSTPFTPPFEPAPGRVRAGVNFIMAGGWDLSLYVRRDGAARDTVLFSGFTVYER